MYLLYKVLFCLHSEVCCVLQKIEEIISEQCVKRYSSLYDKLLSGDIDTSVHRHDLGSHGNYISKISIIFSTLMILLP